MPIWFRKERGYGERGYDPVNSIDQVRFCLFHGGSIFLAPAPISQGLCCKCGLIIWLDLATDLHFFDVVEAQVTCILFSLFPGVKFLDDHRRIGFLDHLIDGVPFEYPLTSLNTVHFFVAQFFCVRDFLFF